MSLVKVRLLYESATGIEHPERVVPEIVDDNLYKEFIEDHLQKTKLKGDTSVVGRSARKHDLYIIHDETVFKKFKLTLKLGSCSVVRTPFWMGTSAMPQMGQTPEDWARMPSCMGHWKWATSFGGTAAITGATQGSKKPVRGRPLEIRLIRAEKAAVSFIQGAAAA